MGMQYGTTEFGAGERPLRLTLADGPLEISWHHCSTTSDFLADFFAARARAAGHDHAEVRNGIGYLANELIENAVKFRAPGEIVIEARLAGDRFELRISNPVSEATAASFQALLAELTAGDPGALLIERIERNAADPGSGGSGLGLLTLMNDYGVQMGWRFTRGAPGAPVQLETHASLPLN
jgi:hypothetical protein